MKATFKKASSCRTPAVCSLSPRCVRESLTFSLLPARSHSAEPPTHACERARTHTHTDWALFGVFRSHSESRSDPPHVSGVLGVLVPTNPHPPSTSGMSQVCLLLVLLILCSYTKVWPSLLLAHVPILERLQQAGA